VPLTSNAFPRRASVSVSLRRTGASGAVEQFLSRQQTVEGVPLIAASTEGGDADTVKSLADALVQRLKSGVVVLAVIAFATQGT